MSDTFLVLTADDKQGTINPEIIGPFPDQDAAVAFAVRLPGVMMTEPDSRWPGELIREPFDGGYAGVVIVNAETASSPIGYRIDDEEEWDDA